MHQSAFLNSHTLKNHVLIGVESFIVHTFTASTEVKIGLTVTFTQNISLTNYEDAKDKMKITVSIFFFSNHFLLN